MINTINRVRAKEMLRVGGTVDVQPGIAGSIGADRFPVRTGPVVHIGNIKARVLAATRGQHCFIEILSKDVGDHVDDILTELKLGMTDISHVLNPDTSHMDLLPEYTAVA